MRIRQITYFATDCSEMRMIMDKIILASGSPRRREILSQVGIAYDVIPSNIEEVITQNTPSLIVEELSKQKAMDVANRNKMAVVLGADTVVALEDKILGKPKDEQDAFEMISALSGRTHFVYTGVTLAKVSQDGSMVSRTFHEKTAVTVSKMSSEEILAYIATKEPMDKAGAYGIQGAFAAYISGIEGDYYNVVGLPICRVMRELKEI